MGIRHIMSGGILTLSVETRQRAEGRRQRAEGRGQKAEGRRQRAEGKEQCCKEEGY
ncbi:MAG: hypothetical protein RIE73_07925 [Coleofasciculus sp. C1-SOL-03]|jgi:hypothetical protein|uniref:hypothetical protein n=1 Tax=Coleofasciculus sp. C1-SOL-03 TaxID=3069522 RepID=UPI003303C0B7